MWHDKCIYLCNLYPNQDKEQSSLCNDSLHTVTGTSDLISVVTHYVQECVVTEMVLNCISLMTNDVEYLFLCLLPICISYFRNYLFELPPHILKGLSVFLLGFRFVCLFVWINSGCKPFVRIFPPRCGLPFHFLDSAKEQKALILIKSSWSVSLFYDRCFWHPK